MATHNAFDQEETFSERIKSLADEELLDIWEETQQLETLLRQELHTELELAPEYERLIVQELQLRSSKKCLPSRP